VGRDTETHGAEVTHQLEATVIVLVITTHTHLVAPQKHSAVLWMLAAYVTRRLQRHRQLTLSEYYDFLRCARLKLETRNNRAKLVGKYLSVIPEDV